MNNISLRFAECKFHFFLRSDGNAVTWMFAFQFVMCVCGLTRDVRLMGGRSRVNRPDAEEQTSDQTTTNLSILGSSADKNCFLRSSSVLKAVLRLRQRDGQCVTVSRRLPPRSNGHDISSTCPDFIRIEGKNFSEASWEY